MLRSAALRSLRSLPPLRRVANRRPVLRTSGGCSPSMYALPSLPTVALGRVYSGGLGCSLGDLYLCGVRCAPACFFCLQACRRGGLTPFFRAAPPVEPPACPPSCPLLTPPIYDVDMSLTRHGLYLDLPRSACLTVAPPPDAPAIGSADAPLSALFYFPVIRHQPMFHVELFGILLSFSYLYSSLKNFVMTSFYPYLSSVPVQRNQYRFSISDTTGKSYSALISNSRLVDQWHSNDPLDAHVAREELIGIITWVNEVFDYEVLPMPTPSL